MILSEWRAASPAKAAADPKVNAVVDPVLRALGADADPEVWVAWGEEPATRYTVFAVTPAGLVACYVRVNVPGEGPRASAKLIRWGRVQVGELGVETQGKHRLLSFQVEGQVLQGADDMADRISQFAILLFASIDGRPAPARLPAARPSRARSVAPSTTTGAPRPRRVAAASGR
jgi:hypothetical protein